MTLIDRYVLRQFLSTFVICYVSLAGIYIVFDAFSNLEEFMRCADQSGGLFRLMSTHYGYRSLLFFDRSAGLLALIATMFTITWIQGHNEMTALMSAGISSLRVATPVIGAVIAIALLAAANRELVIPHFRDELSRKPQNLIGDLPQEFKPCNDEETDIRLWGDSIYAINQRISRPNFLLPPELAAYGNQLEAENGFYSPAMGLRPAGYLLVGVKKPEDLDERASLGRGDDTIVFTYRDVPQWLEPGECFVKSGITFDQLTGGRAWREYSSTKDLIAGLRNPSLAFGADVRVAIHSRIAQPLLDITLLFLGLPLVLTRQSRNVFFAIGLCVAVVAVFSLVVFGFKALGAMSIDSLPPALAVWIPLMLFVPVAVALSDPIWE